MMLASLEQFINEVEKFGARSWRQSSHGRKPGTGCQRQDVRECLTWRVPHIQLNPVLVYLKAGRVVFKHCRHVVLKKKKDFICSSVMEKQQVTKTSQEWPNRSFMSEMVLQTHRIMADTFHSKVSAVKILSTVTIQQTTPWSVVTDTAGIISWLTHFPNDFTGISHSFLPCFNMTVSKRRCVQPAEQVLKLTCSAWHVTSVILVLNFSSV